MCSSSAIVEIAKEFSGIDILKPIIQHPDKVTVTEVSKDNARCVCCVTYPDGHDDTRHLLLKILLCSISSPGSSAEIERQQLEWNALMKLESVSPGSVPKGICYSPKHHAIVMEDLQNFKTLGDIILEGTIDMVLIADLSKKVTKIHRNTHVSHLVADDFQQLLEYFGNEKEVERQSARIFDPLLTKGSDFEALPNEALKKAADRLYSDQHEAVVRGLQTKFREKKQCLIHGDLNPGAILGKDSIAKLIHVNGVHVGPAAYDLGNLLATYIWFYHRHMLTEQNNDWHRQISYKMLDAARMTGETYMRIFDIPITDRQQFFDELISDATGFCACQLLHRVFKSNDPASVREEVLQSGLRLLTAALRINTVDKLLNIGLMLTF